MRNLSIINESEDIVTKDYADQKLPGRPITKYDYDHLSPAEKDADIVYFIIDDDQDALEFDEVPTAGSDNPVKSKGIKSALDAKQNTLTFDQTPTAGSQNPVTSGGVKSAISSSLADIATVETGSTATQNYKKGDYVVVNGNMNRVILPISNGSNFTVDYNIKATNVGSEFNAFFPQRFAATATTFKGAVEEYIASLSNDTKSIATVDYGPAILVIAYKYDASYATYIAFQYNTSYIYNGVQFNGTWTHYRTQGTSF